MSRVHQLIPQSGHIHVYFLLAPGTWSAKPGQQPHAPALHSGSPVLEIDHARLLELLVSGPWPDRPLVLFLMDVDEPRVADTSCHGVERVDASAGTFATS